MPLLRRPVLLAALLFAVVLATIGGAWIFQAFGYAPCELCLKERWPYYAGIPVAALTLLAANGGRAGAARLGFAALALIFLFSAVFGAYHAGVEWGFWPGPSECTGSLARARSSADFLHQLQTVKVVRCDAVAIRILGLSLAGWNALISLALFVLAVRGSRAAG